jgi:Mg-chelatase subunit ChlI/Mg-chelatase subunit ChlD
MYESLNYPFTAIVGQENVKTALLTILVDPTISGVLIIGPKGSGKTTIVRSIIDLLPEIEVIEGCQFHCNPYKPEEMCMKCKETITSGGSIRTRKIKMPFVELPLNATEDMVVGSINWEKAIREGVKDFEPGILAKANRGILYIDQVNLLPDALTDVILDAAASGWNIVEREGVKVVHPAKFILIGTMNPEEGGLRPQILDRFAICVKMDEINRIEDRNEVISRNIEYEEDPQGFIMKWMEKQEELKKKINEARKLLPMIKVSREIEEKAVELCAKMHVDGHRPDITIIKVSKALAALNGRIEVTIDDMLKAAEMVLPHRMKSGEYTPITSEELKQTLIGAVTTTKGVKEEAEEEEIKQVKVEIGESATLPQITKPPAMKSRTLNIPTPIAFLIMGIMYYLVFYFAFAAITLMFAGVRGGGWEEISEFMSTELFKLAAIAFAIYMAIQAIINMLLRRRGRAVMYAKAIRAQEEEARRIITHRIMVKEQIVEAPPPMQKFGSRAFQYIALLGAKIKANYKAAIDKGRKIFQNIYEIMTAPPPLFKITLSSEYMKGRRRGRAEVARGIWIRRGKYVKHALPKEKPYDIAIAPTIRVAAPKQKSRSGGGLAIKIDYDDIRVKVKETRMPLITMIVLDISESMVSSIESVKAAIRGLQKGAHAKRDKVGLIVFKGRNAEVLQYPTTNINAVIEKLVNVGVSDFTPLAAGLKKAREILLMEKSKMKESIPVMVIISDGIANVALENPLSVEYRAKFLNPAQADALDMARKIAKDGIKTIVINTDHRSDEIYKRIYYRKDMQVIFYTPTALMMEIAKITGGKYYGLRADKPMAEIVIEDVVSQMPAIPERVMEPIGFILE